MGWLRGGVGEDGERRGKRYEVEICGVVVEEGDMGAGHSSKSTF